MKGGLAVLLTACVLALAPGEGRGQNWGQNGGQNGDQSGAQRTGADRGTVPGRVQAGAPATLHMHAVLGFSDTFRPGHWTPLTVTLSNSGAALSGHLEVSSIDGDEFRRALYPVTQRRALELGRDARKRFHFTVYLESLARPVRVRVLAGERVLASRDLDLRPRYSAARLLLVVSRDADLDYLNRAGDGGMRVLYPHPDALPRRWQGYDAVAALVLHGLSLESLDAEQFDALSRWVAHGGTLAVSGGPDYALLATPRLAGLLPATPVGMRAIDDAGAVGDALGAPLRGQRPVHVNRVARLRGQVLHEVDDVPLVLSARHGAGQVLYLTFDVARYPFDRWNAMGDVWIRLLDPGDAQATPIHRPDSVSSVPALVRQQVRDFPGHGTLLVFLVLYLSVLATSYRLRSVRSGRPMMLSLTAIGIPLLFAPAAYALFSAWLYPSGPTATVMTVIEPLGRGQAAMRVDLGLHSNRDGPLRFAYEGAAPVMRAPLQVRDRIGTAGWHFGPRWLQPGMPDAYRLHLLEGHDVIAFDLRATASGDGELEVRNDSGRPLREAWLVYRGAAWFLGDVDDHARFDLRRAPDVIASDDDEWWQSLARDRRVDRRRFDAVAEVLSRKTDGEPERSYPGVGEALLLGYTTSPLRATGASAAWRRTQLDLVLLRFPALLPWPQAEDASGEST